MKRKKGKNERTLHEQRERERAAGMNSITQPGIIKNNRHLRYLKVSINVTQLCYSLLKSIHFHGDLEVLCSH